MVWTGQPDTEFREERDGVAIWSPKWGDGSPFDTGEAYDFTQTSGMRDGDVVVCQRDGVTVAAVLVEAWPVAFDGLDEEGLCGELHTIEHPADWATLDDGKYIKSQEAYAAWRSDREAGS